MAYNEAMEHSRYEIINGEEVMLARPVLDHIRIARNLTMIIGSYLRGKHCELFIEPDVFLDEDNNYIPDLVVVCDRDKIRADGIHGAPELVIEILSPRTGKKDIGVKKDAYEKFGVKEYWLVNPKDKSVTVYHSRGGKFVLDNFYAIMEEFESRGMSEAEKSDHTLKLKLSLCDDFVVDVREIFDKVNTH